MSQNQWGIMQSSSVRKREEEIEREAPVGDQHRGHPKRQGQQPQSYGIVGWQFESWGQPRLRVLPIQRDSGQG